MRKELGENEKDRQGIGRFLTIQVPINRKGCMTIYSDAPTLALKLANACGVIVGQIST
jgi:hypothetical protein